MEKVFDQNTEKIRWNEKWENLEPLNYGELKWIFNNYSYRLFDYQCRKYLIGKNYKTFLDFGSGPGNWMIYFAKRFDYKVTGLDYSHTACSLARKNMELVGTEGEFIEGDFNSRCPEKQFDVVYLGGVIEHYKNPREILLKALEYLKPGGTLINRLPTSYGLNWLYVRLLQKEMLDRIWSVDKSKMIHWYESVDLTELEVYYNGSFGLNMFPILKATENYPKLQKFFIFPVWKVINKAVNVSLIFLNDYLHISIEGKLISPMLIAFGVKK